MGLLQPYVGFDPLDRPGGKPRLRMVLTVSEGKKALRRLRAGDDTADIAFELGATQAAVANAISWLREHGLS